jgi:hypothetical protein
MLEPQMEFNSVEHVMPTKNNDEVSEELLDSIANKILIDKRSNAKFSNS